MTYRHNIRLAELEAEVLFNLSKLNAPVPRLITRNGHWLIQEYFEGKRLTQSLNTVSPELQCSLLESAIWSLAEIQKIAAEHIICNP
jgi:RIO-like serine/threonine protein kinase